MPPALAATPPVAPTAASALSGLRARGWSPSVASNVPLGSSAEYNPRLEPGALLGRLVEGFDRIFVLCYRESCAPHTAAGDADGRRVWWPAVQRRVDVFDGADLDRRNIDVVRWAGCDLANRSAGRSGEPVTREPCEFARRGGGADWRRTSKHRLHALLAHLTVVDEAARRNLSSVLVLEADAVPSLAVAELSADSRHASRVARRLSRAFATAPWSVARLSAMFYSKEFVGGGRGGRRACTRRCACGRWAGAAIVEAVAAQPRLCEIAAAPNVSDTIGPMLTGLDTWCDVRDTAAYAVHRSAYPVFSAYLERLRAHPPWLRFGATELPAIDNWLPHALPCVYVLPTLVTQPTVTNASSEATGLMRQTSARNYLDVCGGAAATVDAGPPPPRRPMKLSQFATRHMYVLRERRAARRRDTHS